MFKRMVLNLATKKQLAEAEDFVSRLRVVDGEELGLMVVLTLNIADMFRRNEGWDMFRPSTVLFSVPLATHKLSSLALEMQREQNFPAAGALMVWVHSFRGIEEIKLRALARELWGHLERGFPYAGDAAEMLFEMSGTRSDLSSLGRFPEGLSPVVK